MIIDNFKPIPFHRLFITFLILSILYSCEMGNKMLPFHTGSQGEIVIVIDSTRWNGELKKTIQNVLHTSLYGLPQNEPMYKTIIINKKSFKSIFNTFRNIILFDPDTNYSAPFIVIKNQWAKDQLILKFSGNDSSVIHSFLNHKNEIITIFHNAEMNRMTKKHNNKNIEIKIKKKLSISMFIPKKMKFASMDSNHVYIRIDKSSIKNSINHQISQGILIYKTPYLGPQVFNDSLLQIEIEKILRKYTKGSHQSNMILEKHYHKPKSYEIMFHKKYTKEVRGLWKMTKDYMGGPFYCLLTLDSKEENLIFFFGYVFAPGIDKTILIREIESIAKSIRA